MISERPIRHNEQLPPTEQTPSATEVNVQSSSQDQETLFRNKLDAFIKQIMGSKLSVAKRLALAAITTGIFNAEPAYAQMTFVQDTSHKQTFHEQSEKITETEDINSVIDKYLAQDFTLSEKDIQKELTGVSFVDDVHLQTIDLKQSNNLDDADNSLKKVIDSAIADGTITLDANKINFVQIDFDKIAEHSAAFYDPEHRIIFINQLNHEQRNEKIKSRISQLAIEDERDDIAADIEHSNVSINEKKTKQASLDEWYKTAMDAPEKTKNIQALIKKHDSSIRQLVRSLEEDELSRRVFTQTALPHEAFHDFYYTHLGKKGYEGPSISELLAMALRGKQKRFGSTDTYYAPINDVIKGLNITNETELKKFCDTMTSRFDLFKTNFSQQEKLTLSDEQQENYYIQNKLTQFITEYFARVYETEFYTKETVGRKMSDTFSPYPDLLPRYYDAKQMFPERYPEESKIMHQMKTNGQSLFKN